MTTETPRGRGFRQAVLGDLDALAEMLDGLRADRDADTAAFAGMVVTRRVVLNMKTAAPDGGARAISGLVVRHDGPLLEVADAVLLEDGKQPQAVDGRIIIERAEVAFVQVLG